MIDAVLRVGDRVHTKLSEALGSPGERLSLEEIKAAIQTIGEHQIIFPQAIVTGDVFSRSNDFPFVTLEKGLHIALHTNTGALLRIMEYTIATKKLPDGCFSVFDPHARNCNGFVDGDGHAIYMEFSNLVAMIEYVRKFVRHKGCEKRAPVSEEDLLLTERSFEILAVSYDGGVDSILNRLLQGRSQTRNSTWPSVTSQSKEHKGSSCARDKKRPTSTPPEKPITVVEEFNIKLTESDLNRLNDGEQLNDQIINFYMELINQRTKESAALPRAYCFNSFFYEKLSTCGAKWMTSWTKKINILDYHLLFIPVHLPHHWALGVVNVSLKKISYWDGKQITAPAFFKNIRCFLKDQMSRKRRSFHEVDWMDEFPKAVPVQDNNYDCGMFVCMVRRKL
ncbi:uncharacterized protein LOC114951871 [Acropora millepora]|uniref:uncharacterized protein LOC114951871 n=1 Tax=Acropora millepora TaxID=45264 RepID=UPI001CF4576B|nr:uncharacterized protein LOC114951871 [Acropora millepora]